MRFEQWKPKQIYHMVILTIGIEANQIDEREILYKSNMTYQLQIYTHIHVHAHTKKFILKIQIPTKNESICFFDFLLSHAQTQFVDCASQFSFLCSSPSQFRNTKIVIFWMFMLIEIRKRKWPPDDSTIRFKYTYTHIHARMHWTEVDLMYCVTTLTELKTKTRNMSSNPTE